MADERDYNDWKQSRRRVAVPPEFSDQVMAMIPEAPEQEKTKVLSGRRLQVGQLLASAGLALLGLLRLILVARTLLVP